MPQSGHLGIFNRSYYEEVLIVKVHPEILRGQELPDEIVKDPDIWAKRYRSIVDLENHLHRNGTRIIKFFLHLSKEEQRKRFLKRIDDPDRNWKFQLSDIEERKYWRQYRKAYEECLSATTTRRAPWHVIPADDKRNARLIVSEPVGAAHRDHSAMAVTLKKALTEALRNVKEPDLETLLEARFDKLMSYGKYREVAVT